MRHVIYAKGDYIWVRETTCLRDPEHHPERGYWYAASDDVDEPKWTPSIFMPRAACRIFLEVSSVREERLHAITPEDCVAEGGAYAHELGGVALSRFRETMPMAVDSFRRLFSGPMVRAILEGRKTVTRRLATTARAFDARDTRRLAK